MWRRIADHDAWEAAHSTDVWTIARAGNRFVILRNGLILGFNPRTIQDAERKVMDIIGVEESMRKARVKTPTLTHPTTVG